MSHIKIIPADKLPNRAAKHSVCHELPEWKDILEAIGRLSYNEGFVTELSTKSQSMIGNKNPGAYVVTQLKVHVKNFQIPVDVWSNHGRICVRRAK